MDRAIEIGREYKAGAGTITLLEHTDTRDTYDFGSPQSTEPATLLWNNQPAVIRNDKPTLALFQEGRRRGLTRADEGSWDRQTSSGEIAVGIASGILESWSGPVFFDPPLAFGQIEPTQLRQASAIVQQTFETPHFDDAAQVIASATVEIPTPLVHLRCGEASRVSVVGDVKLILTLMTPFGPQSVIDCQTFLDVSEYDWASGDTKFPVNFITQGGFYPVPLLSRQNYLAPGSTSVTVTVCVTLTVTRQWEGGGETGPGFVSANLLGPFDGVTAWEIPSDMSLVEGYGGAVNVPNISISCKGPVLL